MASTPVSSTTTTTTTTTAVGQDIASGLSSAEFRKLSKPLVEKRRRQRINKCIEQLKQLLLESDDQQCVSDSKLEKADILEATVRHLHHLQCQQSAIDGVAYRAGYTDCLHHVSQYLDTPVDRPIRARLIHYLSLHSTTSEPARMHVGQTSTTTPDNRCRSMLTDVKTETEVTSSPSYNCRGSTMHFRLSSDNQGPLPRSQCTTRRHALCDVNGRQFSSTPGSRTTFRENQLPAMTSSFRIANDVTNARDFVTISHINESENIWRPW